MPVSGLLSFFSNLRHLFQKLAGTGALLPTAARTLLLECRIDFSLGDVRLNQPFIFVNSLLTPIPEEEPVGSKSADCSLLFCSGRTATTAVARVKKPRKAGVSGLLELQAVLSFKRVVVRL
jgi:hypothetical protein